MLNLILVFGATAAVFALVIGLMAVGVLMGRREIKGSCGGLGSASGEEGATACSLCSNPEAACPELARRAQPSSHEGETNVAVADCDRKCEANGCSQDEIEDCKHE